MGEYCEYEAITREYLDTDGNRVSVLWLSCSGSRDDLVRKLKYCDQRGAVVPLVVRTASFNDPNTLLSDMEDIIESNREEFCGEVADSISCGGRCVIVLLGKRELGVPQISSPMQLPNWFPLSAGQSMDLCIDDLSWSGRRGIGSAATRIDLIARSLYDLEDQLCKRMSVVYGRAHNAGSAWMAIAHRMGFPNERIATYLESCRTTLNRITVPHAYRPSMKGGVSVVGTIWCIGTRESIPNVARAADALGMAIASEELVIPEYAESLYSVLARPTSPEVDMRKRFLRSIMWTTVAGCQICTSAAHESEYGLYPIEVLRSVSSDIAQTLKSAVDVLEQ